MLQAVVTSPQDFGGIPMINLGASTRYLTGLTWPKYWKKQNSTVFSLQTYLVRFHSRRDWIYFADQSRTGGYDVYSKSLDPAKISGAQWPVNEPLAVVSAMAAATKSIGFGVTVSTTYEEPYHLARRLSTVDHLTNGRLGWNVSCVVSFESDMR